VASLGSKMIWAPDSLKLILDLKGRTAKDKGQLAP
jgi:hypothetical protein